MIAWHSLNCWWPKHVNVWLALSQLYSIHDTILLYQSKTKPPCFCKSIFVKFFRRLSYWYRSKSQNLTKNLQLWVALVYNLAFNHYKPLYYWEHSTLCIVGGLSLKCFSSPQVIQYCNYDVVVLSSYVTELMTRRLPSTKR